MAKNAVGKVSQIIGAVVDVEFDVLGIWQLESSELTVFVLQLGLNLILPHHKDSQL